MDETQTASETARLYLEAWQNEIKENVYSGDADLIHSIQFHFSTDFNQIHAALEKFGRTVAQALEPLVNENNLDRNLPVLDAYNTIGQRVDHIIHHPSYTLAGEIIYNSGLLTTLAKPGKLSQCLALLFLSSHAGEAGHNCPIACSAGIIRVLQKLPELPDRDYYLEKLTSASYLANFTGAQFLTEIQGGSDVGLNTAYAIKDKTNTWRIYGEKWFCSNAGADLIFITARYDNQPGTKGLALFLVPAVHQDKENNFHIKRLKNKIGTRSMATAEIDFEGAYAIQVGELANGFHLVMDNVLHLSRLFNSFSVLGMARRAYQIAKAYAKHRIAFGQPILKYPLVQETLARIKTDNAAMIAAVLACARMQDELDLDANAKKEAKLLMRLLVNILKYFTAYWSVEHIHLALGILAGNGAIETFSAIPRLLRDCIVCENWEGTHNVLRMQVYKDMMKYNIAEIYLKFMHDLMQKNQIETVDKNLLTRLTQLQKSCIEFSKLPQALQLLQIKVIIDEMAVLYCALQLLLEAMDQAKQKSDMKFTYYHYFLQLHPRDDHVYSEQDLKMMTKIVSA